MSIINKITHTKLKQIEDAHKATDKSTLRFGPNTFPPKEYVKLTDEDMSKIKEELDSMYRCSKCKEKMPRSYYTYKSLCYNCEKEKEIEDKTSWLSDRKKMTIEERIADIESWIYDHSKLDHTRTDFVMR
jgi:hypothetical protein